MSKFNLIAHRADTIKLQTTITRGTSPVNLTGATFVFTAREWKSSSPVISKGNSAFSVSSPASGIVILTIDPADTTFVTDDTKLLCDIEMTESDGRRTTVAYGTLTLLMDITR